MRRSLDYSCFLQTAHPLRNMTPEYYLQLMTMHATIMVFFVLTTAPFAAFGNYFLPIQVGAEDMPFPHFNMMSFWITFIAFCVLVSAFFVGDGPPLAGWTAYAPLSAIGKVAGPGQGTGQVLWATAIGIFCIGQLLGSLNFISTVLDMRTKGMTLARLPVTVWAWFITSCMGLTAFRRFNAGVYPAHSRSCGRDQLLCRFGSSHQRPTAATFRWIDFALAAPVLVLWSS